ncbi:MAG: GtrA family protein [Firmicutes bacterium]|nr:GtrA family protein [Bacillota bacterium]
MKTIIACLNKLIAKINNIKLVHKLLGEKATEQFIKYLVVGFGSFALETTLLALFHTLVSLSRPGFAPETMASYANIPAVTIVFWFNFLLNRNWTFQSFGNIWKQLLIYFPLFFINISAGTFILNWLIRTFGIHYLISKAISVGVVLCWNLIIYKKVIFK